MTPSPAEQNAELDLAWQLVEKTGINVFLTGKAGTGKTTFLRRLKTRLPKRMIVVAPTGVAAINAEGVTIHSFFQLPLLPYVPGGTVKSESHQYQYQFGKHKKNVIRTLDLLVIDEISMVRADVLDAIDDVLRRFRNSRQPFGGVQLLMIGDLQQLAPVVKDDEWAILRDYYATPYFFGSHALQQTRHVTIELQKVYRQTDQTFVDLLNRVRTNTLTDADIEHLNTRVLRGQAPIDGVIRLTTHNRIADSYNESRLNALPGLPFQYKAKVEGNFPTTSFPAEETLLIKPGCQVMFLKNDISGEHLFYNGKLARVVEANNDKILVTGLDDGVPIEVPVMEWTNAHYVIDKETREIREEIEGVFRQYPLRLAWAVTIHKSQGLTFDRAILDVNAAFAAGQVYVALSRCRTLDGLILTEPLSRAAVIIDAGVCRYIDQELQEARNVPDHIDGLKKEYYGYLLAELFDFQPLRFAWQKVLRIIDEHLYRVYPRLLARYKEADKALAEVFDVAPRFTTQCSQLINASVDYEDDALLKERIRKACTWFEDKTFDLLNQLLTDSKNISSDNQKINEQWKEAFETIRGLYNLKINLLRYVFMKGFSVSPYLKEKARILIDMEMDPDKPRRRKTTTAKNDSSGKSTSKTSKAASKTQKASSSPLPTASNPSQTPATTDATRLQSPATSKSRTKASVTPQRPIPANDEEDISYPELYDTLRRWRGAQALRERKAAYQIFSNATLIAITNALPTSARELQRIKGVGSVKNEQYGQAVLEIVQDYVAENADW